MQYVSIPREFEKFLKDAGLVKPTKSLVGVPLSGGVSSDIWRVDLPSGSICIKRALSKLKVQADWIAPIERNAYEVAWMKVVSELLPNQVLPILAHDPKAGMFATPFMSPKQFRIWKTDLQAGKVDTKFAGDVGIALARIHKATANDLKTAKAFASDSIFHSIRLEPYLEATACAHSDVARPLRELISTTAETRQALVHGDISPKNIMVGPRGPLILDAECAWYGDPAFDLAFCLNHFLLKCLHRPKATTEYLKCFEKMTVSYLQIIGRSNAKEIEMRSARLIPGLFLARVDGKSPVEYITRETDKSRVRRVAKSLLCDPVSYLSDVKKIWQEEMSR